MKKIGFDLLVSNRKWSVPRWLISVWSAGLLVLNALLWLDIDGFFSLGTTEENSAKFVAVVESQYKEPISSTTYYESASTAIRQYSVGWSQALASIGSIDSTSDLKIMSLTLTTEDCAVRISIEVSDPAGIFVFIDDLNLKSINKKWILDNLEATFITTKSDGIGKFRAYLKNNS